MKSFQEVPVVLEGPEEQTREGDGDKHVLFPQGAQPLTTKLSGSEAIIENRDSNQRKAYEDITGKELGELGEGQGGLLSRSSA